MKIKNGKIKNINKKLISGALVFTLVMVPLTGCEGYEKFEYTTNEQGEYVASGRIDYELLSGYYFLVIENSTYNVVEYYIADEIKHTGVYSPTYSTYEDIFSGQQIFTTKDSDSRKILICDDLEDYLYASNNVKASYSIEEVEAMFEELKQNYLKNNGKQKIKE